MAIFTGAAFAQSFSPNTFYRLRNISTGQYLHMEQPQLSAGAVMPGWWSAMWRLERVDDGQTYWRIRNRWRDLSLRIDGGLQTGYVAVSAPEAMWTFEAQDAGYVISNRVTGQTLEVVNNNVSAPDRKPSRPGIYWSVEPDSNPLVEDTKAYFLTAAHSLKCIDLGGASSAGIAVVQSDCDQARPSQTWVQRIIDGPYALWVSNVNGKCMDVAGDTSQPGSPIQLADCNPRRQTQWFRAQDDSDSEKGSLVAKSGLCVDVWGWSQSNGAPIQLWHCGRQANQTFTRARAPVTIVSAAAKSVLDVVNQNVLGIEDENPDICWKNTSTRGVGKIPATCPAGYPDYDGALVCYQSCRAGYKGAAFLCWQNCPAGFTDIGVSCAKPAPYGRGGGYGYWWPFEGRNDAIARCQRNTGQSCEMYGELAYPKCAAGYYAFGCCVCSPLCPAGMRDDGAFCAKDAYSRGSASTTCPAGQQYDAGLCYPQCPTGSSGVGPVCWGQCNGSFPTGCGAACAKSASACAFSIIDQVQSTADVVLNVASLVVTAGAATPAIQAARLAAKQAGKRTLTAVARKELKDKAIEAIERGIRAGRTLRKIDAIQGKLDDAGQISDTAEVMVKAYEEGEFDWTSLVPTTVADFDPTGILAVVKAFNKPICK
ncbi:MAG: RICIN domain-containing protein [Bryobacteraceae bacterium]